MAIEFQTKIRKMGVFIFILFASLHLGFSWFSSSRSSKQSPSGKQTATPAAPPAQAQTAGIGEPTANKSEAVKAQGTSARPAPSNTHEQLQEMIQLNEKLKAQYREQAVLVQNITEQARIHKQILADLEKARSVRVVSVPFDQKELVRQEKIRLIREQTEQNYRTLSQLKESTNQASQ